MSNTGQHLGGVEYEDIQQGGDRSNSNVGQYGGSIDLEDLQSSVGWANVARDWAISPDPVEKEEGGFDESSKTHAGFSKDSADASEISADASEISADASQAALADFESQYRGSGDTFPSTDLDDGQLFFYERVDDPANARGMYVYDSVGGGWVPATSTISTIRETQEFLDVEEGRTRFNIIHDPGFINVHLNGAVLYPDDYDDDVTGITLKQPTDEGDDVFLIAWGNITQEPTYVTDLYKESKVMTEVDFFALAEKRKSDCAGSGFTEWGKHYTLTSQINEGLWDYPTEPDVLCTGWSLTSSTGGISRSVVPTVNVVGVDLTVAYVNEKYVGWAGVNYLKLPPAPDGLDKPDGTRTSTYEDGNVISRQDFVFLEVWHEKVSDKGMVCPLGCVQYGASTWEGITLTSGAAPQGYYAFGDWDTTTTGYSANWDGMSTEDQDKFKADPRNNIYMSKEGDLIQVRYRIRVTPGGQGDWSNVNVTTVGGSWLHATDRYVACQGMLTTPYGLSSLGTVHFRKKGTTDQNGYVTAWNNTGEYYQPVVGHEGKCYAVPIALVQRLNQGAYHPSYNILGCGRTVNTGNTVSYHWYQTNPDLALDSVSKCFQRSQAGVQPGYILSNIANGSAYNSRPDGQYYDAIYAAYVNDLRMRTLVRPVKEIHDEYILKAQAGEVRGFEMVPFTTPIPGSELGTGGDSNKARKWKIDSGGAFAFAYFDVDSSKYPVGSEFIIHDTTGGGTYLIATVTVSSSGAYLYGPIKRTYNGYVIVPNADGSASPAGNLFPMVTSFISHRAAEHTWTDIIGDPARIAATFPNGVIGEWIPVIPDGTTKTWKANRKFTSVVGRTYTDDDGATWANLSDWTGQGGGNEVTNTVAETALPATRLALSDYKTPAHFTEYANNNTVLHLGTPLAFCHYLPDYGNILMSSLIGVIGTNSDTANLITANMPLRSYIIDTNGNKLNGTWGPGITHDAPWTSAPTNGSDGVKILSYAISDYGSTALCMSYKQMIYDTSWGDDNRFVALNGQTTNTDTNGNTILVGSAYFRTPYFYPEHLGS